MVNSPSSNGWASMNARYGCWICLAAVSFSSTSGAMRSTRSVRMKSYERKSPIVRITSYGVLSGRKSAASVTSATAGES